MGRFYSKVSLDSLTDCGPFNSINCRQFSKTDSKGKTLLTGSTELKPDSKTCIAISTQVGCVGVRCSSVKCFRTLGWGRQLQSARLVVGYKWPPMGMRACYSNGMKLNEAAMFIIFQNDYSQMSDFMVLVL